MGWWKIDIDGTVYEQYALTKPDAVYGALRKHDNFERFCPNSIRVPDEGWKENYTVGRQAHKAWAAGSTLIGVERVPTPEGKKRPNPRGWLE